MGLAIKAIPKSACKIKHISSCQRRRPHIVEMQAYERSFGCDTAIDKAYRGKPSKCKTSI
jgi:hypothetical protein